MARLKRQTIGSFLQSKDKTKPPYIKMKANISFKEGDMIRVESKKFQLESLNGAIAAGKLPADIGEKALERVNNIPDFVIGDLVLLVPEA